MCMKEWNKIEIEEGAKSLTTASMQFDETDYQHFLYMITYAKKMGWSDEQFVSYLSSLLIHVVHTVNGSGTIFSSLCEGKRYTVYVTEEEKK